MIDFFNKIDGSKLAIFYSFTLALAGVIFIGLRILLVDGEAVVTEIQFLQGIIQTIVYAGFGISSFHVGVGAIAAHRRAKLQVESASQKVNDTAQSAQQIAQQVAPEAKA